MRVRKDGVASTSSEASSAQPWCSLKEHTWPLTDKPHCLLLALGFIHSLMTSPSHLQVLLHFGLCDNNLLCGGLSSSLALLSSEISLITTTRTAPSTKFSLTLALSPIAVVARRTFPLRTALSVLVSENSVAKTCSRAKSAAQAWGHGPPHPSAVCVLLSRGFS